MTVNFFVPHATSPMHAEDMYQAFAKLGDYPPLDLNRRVYSLTFRNDGEEFQATVGKMIPGRDWRHAGIVLAIIESRNLVYVHTESRNAYCAGPVLAGRPEDCHNRQWFSDFAPPKI